MKIIHLRNITDREAEPLSPSPMTEEETARIKNKVFEAISTEKVPRRKRKLFPMIAAAMLCVMLFAACTAAVLHWNDNFSEKLNLGKEEKAYAEKTGIAQSVGEITDSCSGVTLRLRQALATENLCYLIIDAEFPDQQIYFAEGASIVDELMLSGLNFTTGPITLSTSKDMTVENNVLSMYLIGYYEDPTQEEIPVKVSFKNLTYRTVSEVRTVEGLWTLECTVKKNTEKRTGTVDLPCQLPMTDRAPVSRTVTGYTLTPLEATFDLDLKFDDEFDMENVTLKLYYKNGESAEVDCRSNLDHHVLTGNQDPISKKYRYTYRICLDRLIQTEEIAAMEFCGTVINLS